MLCFGHSRLLVLLSWLWLGVEAEGKKKRIITVLRHRVPGPSKLNRAAHLKIEEAIAVTIDARAVLFSEDYVVFVVAAGVLC